MEATPHRSDVGSYIGMLSRDMGESEEREGMALLPGIQETSEWPPGTGHEVLSITQGLKLSVRGRLHENSLQAVDILGGTILAVGLCYTL